MDRPSSQINLENLNVCAESTFAILHNTTAFHLGQLYSSLHVPTTELRGYSHALKAN